MDRTTTGQLRRAIPVFGAQQPIGEVREAYWRLTGLTENGWYVRSFGYRYFDRRAYAHVITPRQRALTAMCPSLRQTPSPAWEFACAVRDVGVRSERDRYDHVGVLYQAVYSRPRAQMPAVQYQTRPIPGLDIQSQPSTAVRVAYWMSAMLIDVYGWSIHSLGTRMAAGGVIASIPDDTIVIYPKDGALDSTIAPALARVVGRLNAAELARLRCLLGIDSSIDDPR